jgi:hypothetical protein
MICPVFSHEEELGIYNWHIIEENSNLLNCHESEGPILWGESGNMEPESDSFVSRFVWKGGYDRVEW